jgi:hypothetical protein
MMPQCMTYVCYPTHIHLLTLLMTVLVHMYYACINRDLTKMYVYFLVFIIHMFILSCIHAHISAYMYVYAYVCIHKLTKKKQIFHVYACDIIYIYVYVYIYIYISNETLYTSRMEIQFYAYAHIHMSY